MTVSSQQSEVQYAGDGVTTVFAVPFYFLENTHISVMLFNALGSVIPQVLDVDYTLTGAGDLSGGTLTFTTEPLPGYTVEILREVPLTQLTDYQPNDDFPAESHERALDKLTMMAQQVESSSSSAIRVAIGDPKPNRLPPVVARANLLMSFDNAGNPIAVAPVDGSATALALLLASPAGASNVYGQLSAVGTVAQSIQAYMSNKVFVGQFGAVCDGVTDDGPAVRRALDAVPAGGGGVGWPDWSNCKIVGTVFIPQRISAVGVPGQGIQLYGNNCTIIGDGSSTIFESGTGTKSTVALGGASNWPLGNELPTTIHYNSRIEGFNFKTCGTVMKLKNWIQGCVVERLYATDFTGQMLWTNRCFYLAQRDLQGRPFRDDRAGSMPIFQYDDSNNTMTFDNVHGSGISPSGLPKGLGMQFDSGVQGVHLGGGVSLEACIRGINLRSIIYSMSIVGVYFEMCTTAVQSDGANILNLFMEANEFEDCDNDVNIENWVDGSFGPANRTEASVTFGPTCTHDVWLPEQALSDLNHNTWVRAPVGWTIPAGCQVHRNDIIFNSAIGFNGVWFRNDPRSSGNTGVVPKSYTGDCFNVGDIIPYCTVTGVGATTLVITTKIAWNPNLAAVRFDLVVDHSSSSVIAGILSCNNTVFRDDAVPGITITPSDSGGFLRLTLSGFGTITSFSGQVRII